MVIRAFSDVPIPSRSDLAGDSFAEPAEDVGFGVSEFPTGEYGQDLEEHTRDVIQWLVNSIDGKRWDEVPYEVYYDISPAVLKPAAMRYYIQGKLLVPRHPGDVINIHYEDTSLSDLGYLEELLAICSDAQAEALFLYVKTLSLEEHGSPREDVRDFWIAYRWKRFGRRTLISWDLKDPWHGDIVKPHFAPNPTN